jgi:hypothetical protein
MKSSLLLFALKILNWGGGGVEVQDDDQNIASFLRHLLKSAISVTGVHDVEG